MAITLYRLTLINSRRRKMVFQRLGVSRLLSLWLFGSALAGSAMAVDLTATGDAYTQSASPTSNFGSSGVTAVAVDRTTLIQFDPVAVAQSSGAHATLKVKVLLAKNGTDGVTARLVTAPWNEKTVTAQTMPTISPNILDGKVITTTNQGQVVTFDVSGALANWRANPAANFGIALVPASPTPNLQLGAREGGSPAVLTLGGFSQKNNVTVAVSGGDYPDPQTAVDNAFAGDKWCVMPPFTDVCTIHVNEGIYPKGSVTLPPRMALVGASRGSTILVGTVAAGNSVISDLTIDGTFKSTFDDGQIELDRISLRSHNNVEILELGNGSGSVIMTDSDVTADMDDKTDLPIFGFDCDVRCQLIRVVRSRITFIGSAGPRGGVAGFTFASDAGQRLELEDTFIHVVNGLAIQTTSDFNSVIITGGGISGGIDGNGVGSLTVTNATIDGGISWVDAGSIAIDSAAIQGGLTVGPDFFGPGGPMTVTHSSLGAMAVANRTFKLDESIVTGDVTLDNSTGTLTSDHIGGQLTLTASHGPSKATCTRVFDSKLQLLPPNCVKQ
jgi:hypothetical protein